MVAPVVLSRVGSVSTTSSTSNSTTFSPTLPTVTVGKALLAIVATDANPTVTTTSEGWEKVIGDGNGSSICGTAFIKRRATGSDALTVTSTSAEQFSAIVYCIDAGEHFDVAALSVDGSSTNSDPPAVTLYGALECLLIAARMGDALVVPTFAPSGYSSLLNRAGGSTNGASTSVAEKTATVSSEDPGAFTVSSEQWVAATIALWRESTTKWGEIRHGDGAVLSNSNLKVTSTGALAEDEYARGTLGRSTGKFSIGATIQGNSFAFFGLVPIGLDLNDNPNPRDGGMVGYRCQTPDGGTGEGRAYVGADVYTSGLPLAGDGDEVITHWDLDAERFWVEINGVLTSGDPGAGTGGYSFSGEFSAGELLFPLGGGDRDYGWGYSAAEVTVDAALSGKTLPSGFEPWDGAAAAAATPTASSWLIAA